VLCSALLYFTVFVSITIFFGFWFLPTHDWIMKWLLFFPKERYYFQCFAYFHTLGNREQKKVKIWDWLKCYSSWLPCELHVTGQFFLFKSMIS
jgi:hypothetical protein